MLEHLRVLAIATRIRDTRSEQLESSRRRCNHVHLRTHAYLFFPFRLSPPAGLRRCSRPLRLDNLLSIYALWTTYLFLERGAAILNSSFNRDKMSQKSLSSSIYNWTRAQRSVLIRICIISERSFEKQLQMISGPSTFVSRARHVSEPRAVEWTLSNIG